MNLRHGGQRHSGRLMRAIEHAVRGIAFAAITWSLITIMFLTL